MKVYIETYGCTFNQADSELIAGALHRDGIETCGSEKEADVVMMNTCTVKGATQNRITYRLSNLEKSGKRVMVTGCMAGANSDIIEKYSPSASIMSIQNIAAMPETVRQMASGNRAVSLQRQPFDRLDFYEANGSVIAKVPLSDGCLSSCAFCETKFARGKLSSFPEQSILNAIRYSISKGSKEIEITAQDTGAYGIDKGTNIASLLKKACAIDGDFRIRVGMLNPEHLHRYVDDLIDAMHNEHAYKFLHLPVQSGSDKVLASMRRGYTIESYLDAVKYIRQRVKGITIETDIIVGFPGETEEDFEETINAVNEFKPDVTNISKFTARPHASASNMPQLNDKVIKDRSARLSRMIRAMQSSTNKSLVGSTISVLFTEENNASMNGRDDSYKQIVVQKAGIEGNYATGSRADVKIYDATANALYGNIM